MTVPVRKWRNYWPTPKAQQLLKPPRMEFRNDHSEACSCFECVMRRIEASR